MILTIFVIMSILFRLLQTEANNNNKQKIILRQTVLVLIRRACPRVNLQLVPGQDRSKQVVFCWGFANYTAKAVWVINGNVFLGVCLESSRHGHGDRIGARVLDPSRQDYCEESCMIMRFTRPPLTHVYGLSSYSRLESLPPFVRLVHENL